MIQNSINKYTVLPPEHEQDQGIPTLDHQSENSVSHYKNNDEQNPLQSQQGRLVVQGERVAINIAEPAVTTADFDDRELVHEYSDYYLGYRYRRIRKEKVGEDGTKDEDEIEVDQTIFASELGLEDTILWVMRGNLRRMFIGWLILSLFMLSVSIYVLITAYSGDNLMLVIINNIILNVVFFGATLWQRRLYRIALREKDFKEGKKQLKGFANLPALFLWTGFVCSLSAYMFAK